MKIFTFENCDKKNETIEMKEEKEKNSCELNDEIHTRKREKQKRERH